MESLHRRRRIFPRDIETVYESLFLRAVLGFENFCESLFFDILNGNIRYRTNEVEPWVKRCDSERLREIVHRGTRYLSWIPYDKALITSKLFLDEGKPFSNLDANEKNMIAKIVVIRNAIAHSSPHSKKQFNNDVIRGLALQDREKTPGGYLRSVARTTPSIERQFEMYAGQLGLIAAKMSGRPRWSRRTK